MTALAAACQPPEGMWLYRQHSTWHSTVIAELHSHTRVPQLNAGPKTGGEAGPLSGKEKPNVHPNLWRQQQNQKAPNFLKAVSHEG